MLKKNYLFTLALLALPTVANYSMDTTSVVKNKPALKKAPLSLKALAATKVIGHSLLKSIAPEPRETYTNIINAIYAQDLLPFVINNSPTASVNHLPAFALAKPTILINNQSIAPGSFNVFHFNDSGSHALTVCSKSIMRLTTETGKCEAFTLPQGMKNPRFVALSNDGNYCLIAIGRSVTFLYFDAQTKCLVAKRAADVSEKLKISCLAISPDNNSYAIGFTDGTIIHADMQTGKRITFKLEDKITVLSMPESTLIIAAAQDVFMLNLVDSKKSYKIKGLERNIKKIICHQSCFEDEEKQLIISYYIVALMDDETLALYDMGTNSLIAISGLLCSSSAMTKDGKAVCVIETDVAEPANLKYYFSCYNILDLLNQQKVKNLLSAAQAEKLKALAELKELEKNIDVNRFAIKKSCIAIEVFEENEIALKLEIEKFTPLHYQNVLNKTNATKQRFITPNAGHIIAVTKTTENYEGYIGIMGGGAKTFSETKSFVTVNMREIVNTLDHINAETAALLAQKYSNSPITMPLSYAAYKKNPGYKKTPEAIRALVEKLLFLKIIDVPIEPVLAAASVNPVLAVAPNQEDSWLTRFKNFINMR